jgi:hypothetical protein
MTIRSVLRCVVLVSLPFLSVPGVWAQSPDGGGSAGRTVGYVIGVGIVVVLVIRAFRGKK